MYFMGDTEEIQEAHSTYLNGKNSRDLILGVECEIKSMLSSHQ